MIVEFVEVLGYLLLQPSFHAKCHDASFRGEACRWLSVRSIAVEPILYGRDALRKSERSNRGSGRGGASSFFGCGRSFFSGLRECARSRRGPEGCARLGFC